MEDLFRFILARPAQRAAEDSIHIISLFMTTLLRFRCVHRLRMKVVFVAFAGACSPARGPVTRPIVPCCSLLATLPEMTDTRYNSPVVARRIGPLGLGRDSIWSALTFLPSGIDGKYPTWDIDEASAFDPRLTGGWVMRLVLTTGPDFGTTSPSRLPSVPAGTVVEYTQDATGHWSARGNAFPTAGKQFELTSVTAVGNRIFACASTSDNEIWWSEWDARSGESGVRREGRLADFASGAHGSIEDVACATVGPPSYDDAHPTQTLHVCVITNEGFPFAKRRAWHLASAPLTRDGGEQPLFGSLEDIEAGAGYVGNWDIIDCAGTDKGRLYVVGVSSGSVYYAVSNGFGLWNQWQVMPRRSFASGPLTFNVLGPVTSLAIGFCNDGVPAMGLQDVFQLNVAMIIGGQLYFSVLASDPLSWQPRPPPTTFVTLSVQPGAVIMTKETLNLSPSFAPQAPPSRWRPLESGQGRPGHSTNAPWGKLSISSRPFQICRDEDSSFLCIEP